MNDSSKWIRHVVIPIIWVFAVIVDVCICALQVISSLAHPLFQSWIGMLLVLAGVLWIALIFATFWKAKADMIDNLASIAKSADILANHFQTEKHEYASVEELVLKKRILVEKYKKNNLSESEKASLYQAIKQIDAEIQKRQNGV